MAKEEGLSVVNAHLVDESYLSGGTQSLADKVLMTQAMKMMPEVHHTENNSDHVVKTEVDAP